MTSLIVEEASEHNVARQRDAAAHIGSVSVELAQLARRHGFEALGYLLDMVRLEADTLTRERPEPSLSQHPNQGALTPMRSRNRRSG
jgi:hypothetical protein